MKHDWEASGSVSSDGKDKGLKSNFFQQRKLGDANANANLEPLLEEEKEEEDSVSAAILSELKTFRRENNEKLTAITSAMTSLEQSVEKMGEHLTHAASRINQAEEGSTRTTHLVGYLLRCKRELLDIPAFAPLQLERAHRSLQQRPTDENAPPQSLVVRFVNHQHKQQVLTKAWSMKNLQHKGERIYMDHDYSPALQKKRCEYADIKKQLKERNIRFQTPYPAKLKVHLREDMKTYNSAWEAAGAYCHWEL